ncbi:hypothetical protein, partial [Burkholderia ambifaria]|uniref:hypothetical protein n=1 Tax=Burkholderia ambifaria TaxID=152480 RepID=UPI001ABA67D3
NCCANSASVRSPLTAASATFALNAAECVRRVLFVISSVPLPALSLAQAPAKPLIRLSKFARPPLYTAGRPCFGLRDAVCFATWTKKTIDAELADLLAGYGIKYQVSIS